MPYNKTDKILIVKDNWTDTLIVNYSEIYHTDKIEFGVKCECENSYILKLSSDSLSIDIQFDNSREVENSEIVINDEWLNYSERIDKLKINGKEYYDLIIYKNISQTTKNRFEKIIISKSIGIISIVDSNNDWTIKNDSKKDIDMSKISFKNINCK